MQAVAAVSEPEINKWIKAFPRQIHD